jgi:hypothetical protein
MFKMAKLGIAIAAVLVLIVPAAYAGVPDVNNSFYVPQIGTVGTPIEGATALLQFKACPNNDGSTSFAANARIKIVVRDVNNNPIAGINAGDICLLFNGGTVAQGFTGVGADSILANSTFNPTCPNVRCVAADAPTDASGTTYITFRGADEATPGVSVRDANRKWGERDSEIPVYVLGFKIPGFLQTAKINPYVLRIKNFDLALSEGFCTNPGDPLCTGTGERVNGVDFNQLVARLNKTFLAFIDYWYDYNNDNSINGLDYNQFIPHLNHNCTAPNNP